MRAPQTHRYWNDPRSATVGDAHVRPAGSPWRAPTADWTCYECHGWVSFLRGWVSFLRGCFLRSFRFENVARAAISWFLSSSSYLHFFRHRDGQRAGAVGGAHARPANHRYWNDPRSATVGDAHVRPAGSPWRAPTADWTCYECHGWVSFLRGWVSFLRAAFCDPSI